MINKKIIKKTLQENGGSVLEIQETRCKSIEYNKKNKNHYAVVDASVSIPMDVFGGEGDFNSNVEFKFPISIKNLSKKYSIDKNKISKKIDKAEVAVSDTSVVFDKLTMSFRVYACLRFANVDKKNNSNGCSVCSTVE